MKKVITGIGISLLLGSLAARATTTIEAESMLLSGYVRQGAVIAVAEGKKSGTATHTFSGTPGRYDVTVNVRAESAGSPTLTVYKGAVLLHKYSYPRTNSDASFKISNVALAAGDTISLVGTTQSRANALVDNLLLTPRAASAPAPGAPTYPPQGATGGVPVVPGASGFGINARAGRGGTVFRVTNLNESGKGSLKACVDATVPRVCVFETSGTIVMSSVLNIRNPYVTIAGQTAPAPGITIRGAGIKVETNEVLLQHLRVRVGDDPTGAGSNRDGVAIVATTRDVYNVVLDHLSVSWGTDELFSTWADPNGIYRIYDVTVRNTLFSEALSNSINTAGEHSAAFLVGPGTSRLTAVGNVFAFNGRSNPVIRDNSTDVMVVNNLLYRTRGAGNDQIEFGARGSLNTAVRAAVVGNNFVLAPGLTPQPTIFIDSQAASIVQLHQRNNLGPLASSDPWTVVALNGRSRSSVEAYAAPIWAQGAVAMDAASVEAYTLGVSGARPGDRDAVDARIVANVRGRTGGIINRPADVGGWPSLAMNKRVLTLPANPNVTNSSGYTNLELWLHQMARAVEGPESTAPVPAEPPPAVPEPTAPSVIEPIALAGKGYRLVKNWDFVTGIRDQVKLREEFHTRYIYGNGTLDALNDEWQRYRDNNNHVFEAEGLALVAKLMDGATLAPGSIDSGMLRSKWYGQYGYYEVKMKVPPGLGMWPAFWLNPQDGIWPPEIDVVEIVNNGRDTTANSFHITRVSSGQGQPATYSLLDQWSSYRPGFDYKDGYHTFAVEWTPDRVRHFVDDVLVVDRPYVWAHADGRDGGPAHVLLNLAVGGSWPGAPTAASLPAKLLVKHIRVWQR